MVVEGLKEGGEAGPQRSKLPHPFGCMANLEASNNYIFNAATLDVRRIMREVQEEIQLWSAVGARGLRALM